MLLTNQTREGRIILILKIKTKTHLLLLYFVKVVPKKKKNLNVTHQPNKRGTYYLNSQNKNKDTSFAFIFCKSGPKTKK